MNGWQRLWVFLGSLWMLIWIWYLLRSGWSWEDSIWALGIAVFWWALLYAIGLGMAWVVRGFRR